MTRPNDDTSLPGCSANDTTQPWSDEDYKRTIKRVEIFIGVIIAFVLIYFFVDFILGQALFFMCFGWIWFSFGIGHEVVADWPQVAMGAVALLLFTGITSYGWNWIWQGQATAVASQSKWNGVRAAVAILLSFTAGLSVVGVVSTTNWLLSTTEPLVGIRVDPSAYSRNNLRNITGALRNY